MKYGTKQSVISEGMNIALGSGTHDQAREETRSIISVKDMTTLVMIYDAVKELNTVLYGGLEIHRKCDGIMGILESISDVIDSGLCEEIKLLGDEKSAEKMAYILDADTTPEEKAKQLLGII